jgi:hypothetical protein
VQVGRLAALQDVDPYPLVRVGLLSQVAQAPFLEAEVGGVGVGAAILGFLPGCPDLVNLAGVDLVEPRQFSWALMERPAALQACSTV